MLAGSDDRDPGGVGHVYAWDRSSGRLRWKRAAGHGFMADLLRRGSRVYAVSLADELLCLDLASGATRWTLRSRAVIDEAAFAGFQTAPLLSGRRLFFGGQDGVVYAIDADAGRLIWKRDLGAPIASSLTGAGDVVYAATAGSLSRLRAVDGRVLGSIALQTRPSGPPVPFAGGVFMFMVDARSTGEPELLLRSYDAALSRERWTRTIDGGWTSARPRFWRGRLVAGGRRGALTALRPRDGGHIWAAALQGAVRGIGFDNRRLYVGTLRGTLFAYEPPD